MVLLLVPIALILIAFVSYSTAQMNHAWADAIVRGFTAWIKSIPLVGEAVERLIASGATWIANRLGKVYLGVQSRAVNWIGAFGHYAWMIANATLDWPVELATTVRWLLTKEIPHLIRGLPNAVTRLVHNAQKVIGGLERDVARLYAHLPGQVRKLIHGGLIGLVGPFLLPLRWLLHHWRQISHAAVAAGGIAVPWIYVPKIWRRLHAQNLRLTRVEKLLGVTAMSIVLSRVLRVSPRCLTTGNIGRVSRALCRLPTRAIEDILGLLADVLIISEICDVIPYLERGFEVIAEPLTGLIGEAGAALCGGDFDEPPRLAIPSLSIPALVGFTTVEV